MGERTVGKSGGREINVSMRGAEVKTGDNVFLLDISVLDDNYLSSDTLCSLEGKVELFTVTLDRIEGNNPVSPYQLGILEEMIARFMKDHPNGVLCYYCDYLNSIPAIRKNRPSITVQEYRSKLFEAVFNRYCHHHPDTSFAQSILTIEGEENYYIHLIASKNLSTFVDVIAEDLQTGYGKD